MLKLLLFFSFICLVTSLKCFPLSVPICKGFGYSFTTIPRAKQLLAQEKLKQVIGRVSDKTKCHEYITPFLCFNFIPKCRKRVDYPVRPCQATCRFIQRRCKTQVLELWRNDIDCNKNFLARSRQVQCLSTAKLKGLSKTTGAKPIKQPSTSTPGQTETTTSPLTSSGGNVVFTKSPTISEPATTTTTTATPSVSTTEAPTTTLPTTQTSTTEASTVPTQVLTVATTVIDSYQSTKKVEIPDVTPKTSTVANTTPVDRPSTTEQVWVASRKKTASRTTSVVTEANITTARPATNYTGPIFNPFYPPTFAKFVDPRKRKMKTPTTTTTSSTPSTTTSGGSEQNETTADPWYRSIDRNWLVSQLNSSLRAGLGYSTDYTADWDLTNYTAFMQNVKRKKRKPWYKQDYESIIKKVNVNEIGWKSITWNGTTEKPPSAAERKEIFYKFFVHDKERDDQADSQ